jgi:flagellar export protein FliJ
LAKFKYKFDIIKEIKQQLEKKAQKELAVIDVDIANNNNKIFELAKLLKEQKKKKLDKKSKTIKEYHFDEKYESYLVEQIELIRKYIAKKKIERNKKLQELIKKSKETKTFEKLEEKHFADFIKTQEKLEQKEMDEFAVKEFIKEK